MKYKLIKEYPGSPKLGHIICCNDFTHNGIDRHSCSDYPEFWEEVVEKDYEVLYVVFNNNIFPATYMNLNECTHIHKVKRLSDGEVFTIGDKVIWDTVQITIKEFQITYANVLWCVGSTGNKLNLKSVQHVKQPLFTTEDGVDIYPGDKNSTVSLDTMELYTIDGLAGNSTTPEKGFKYFSTKEKAEEYVLYNKPCLNIQEVLNNIEYNPHWNISEFLKVIKMNLETTVKQKLNK